MGPKRANKPGPAELTYAKEMKAARDLEAGMPLKVSVTPHDDARIRKKTGQQLQDRIKELENGGFIVHPLFKNRQVKVPVTRSEKFGRLVRFIESHPNLKLKAVILPQRLSKTDDPQALDLDQLTFSAPPALVTDSFRARPNPKANLMLVISKTKGEADRPIVDFERTDEHGSFLLTSHDEISNKKNRGGCNTATFLNKPYTGGMYRYVVVLWSESEKRVVEFEKMPVVGFDPGVCLPYAKPKPKAEGEPGKEAAACQQKKRQRGRPSSGSDDCEDEGDPLDEDFTPRAPRKTRRRASPLLPTPTPARSTSAGPAAGDPPAPVQINPTEDEPAAEAEAEAQAEGEPPRDDDDDDDVTALSSGPPASQPAPFWMTPCPTEARLVGVSDGATLASGAALEVHFPSFFSHALGPAGVRLRVTVTTGDPYPPSTTSRDVPIDRERLRIEGLLTSGRDNAVELSLPTPSFQLARPVATRLFVLPEGHELNAARDACGVVPSRLLAHLALFRTLPSELGTGTVPSPRAATPASSPAGEDPEAEELPTLSTLEMPQESSEELFRWPSG